MCELLYFVKSIVDITSIAFGSLWFLLISPKADKDFSPNTLNRSFNVIFRSIETKLQKCN